MICKFTENQCKESIKKANYFAEGAAVAAILERGKLTQKQREAVLSAIKQAYYEGFLSGMERARG